MPSDSVNRTLVLSVVAVDLVGYSRKSVAEQMSLKDGFNQVLLQAIRDISVDDRIILDTGDGVAMGFLGDPEDALYVAMFMHDAINRDSAGSPSGSMDSNAIRIGVNLGPVKLATGAGGHPNIIGDGINVAERIMSFAEPGQLTASRAFYEVMSRMSDHYATLFQFAGARADKQVRVHDVYIVGKSAPAFRQAQRGVAERAATRANYASAGQYAFPPAVSQAPTTVAAVAHATSDTNPRQQMGFMAKTSSIESTAPVPKSQEPVASSAKPLESASRDGSAPSNDTLIDFLEDRNKVATTATLLVVIAVTLAALLVYRKMQVLVPDNAPASVATLTQPPSATSPPADDAKAVPAPVAIPTNTPVPISPSPTLVQQPATSKTEATDTRTLTAPKPDVKPTLPVPTIPSPAPAVAVTSPPPAKPSVPSPATIAPGAIPAKTVERAPPAGAAELPGAAALRDKSGDKSGDKAKDTRIEKPDKADKSDKMDRADKADKADKTGKADKGGIRDDIRKPRTTGERPAPGTVTPIVPSFQSPAEAPRPEIVAPTPVPTPTVAPPADTSIVAVLRNNPAFPVEAVRQGIASGFVRARITIDANGNVSDVAILESRPISAFGRETRATASKWRFNRGAAGRTQEFELSFKP